VVGRTLGLAVSDGVNVVLAGLEVGKVTSLVVNVEDLLAALVVEASELLTSGGAESLLEVRVQARPGSDTLVSDTILLVKALSLGSGLVLGIELLEGGGEASADAVLLVKGKSALNGLVADGVAVGKVLCNDARAGLVVLRDVFGVLFVSSTQLSTRKLVEGGGSGDVDLVGTELGVVEEESSLGGRLLLESDRSRLDAVGRVGLGGDGDV
jgi:hypothetical protein